MGGAVECSPNKDEPEGTMSGKVTCTGDAHTLTLTHTHTHSLTHSLTHSHTHTRTHTRAHTPAQVKLVMGTPDVFLRSEIN